MWSHFNDIAAVCAGVGLAAGNIELRRAHRTRPPAERRADGPPLPLRLRPGRRQRARRSAADAVRAARDEIAALANGLGSQLARAGLQRVVPGPAARHRRRQRRGSRSGSARSGLPRARRGSPRTPASASRRLAYDGFEPVVPKRAVGDVRARLEQRALELLQTFALLDGLLDRPVGPASAEPGAQERPIGVGRVESPRGATSCIVERRQRPDRAAAAPDRLVRELAGRRARRRRQPASRLPADQQELRALLRLRGPLMLTLLRDLRRLRKSIDLPQPEPRTQPRDPPRRRGLLQRLRARARPSSRARTTTCSASASASSPRLATPTCSSSPAPVTSRMREPLLDRLQRDARAAPRRRARRLRARLRRARHRREPRRPGRRDPAGRPPHPGLPADARQRSPRRCSSSSTRRAPRRRNPCRIQVEELKCGAEAG